MRRQRPEHFRFQEGVVLNLRRKYPISSRWVLKRCLATIEAFFVAVLVSVSGLPRIQQLVERDLSSWQHTLFLLCILLFVVFLVKLGYELLARHYYYYAIEGSNLVIAKGVILRQRGCFPITQITDVYLNRTFSEFIFGLYSLNVSTPTTHSAEFACIDGLPRDTAVALQDELMHILHAQELQNREEKESTSIDAAQDLLPMSDDPKLLPH